MKLRILIVDDHVAVQRGIEDILSASFESAEFGRAGSAHEALDRLRESCWDVAVVDLSLPGRGGLDLVSSLKEVQPKLQVLVYSMQPEDQFGVRALKAGADGYLTKDAPADEIARAVRALLDTGQYIGPSLAAAMAARLKAGVAEPQLSDREYQVLQKVASGKTPTEIAEEMSLSIKTVSTYRSRLLEKLNLRTTADLIRYAIDKGITG